MKKNKQYLLSQLVEKAKLTEGEAEIVNGILDDHFIVGHNNKEKIKNDIITKLNLDEKAADDLYNTVSEIIVKGVFTK